MTAKDNIDHLWGFALLPDAFPYPCRGEENPMTLVCQARWDEGIVCIFADLDYFFGDIEADGGHLGEWGRDYFKVVYTGLDTPLHLHEIRYPDGTPAVPESQPLGDTFLHPPTCWQDELEQDFPGYEVLLQLEEDEEIGLRFYDCGTLFFLIRPEDLAAHHFDRVRCVLYSY